VKTLGGNTKITLREAISCGVVVVTLVGYMHTQFNGIKSMIRDSWSVQNQSEWQSEYQRTGQMPNAFEIHRRTGEQGRNDVNKNAIAPVIAVK
jgi:hypothetical protein